MSVRTAMDRARWPVGLAAGVLLLVGGRTEAEKVSTEDVKTDAVMVALQKKSKEVESCTARLLTTFEMMEQKVEVQNRAAFKAPSRIRLETEGEPKQTTVSDGGLLWIYNAQERMAHRINLSRFFIATGREADADQPDPTRPFRGLQWKTIRFVGSELLEGEKHRVFEAVPEISLLQAQLPVVLAKVRIYIHPDDGLLRRVEIFDASDAVVILQQFEGLVVNPKLEDSQFEFVVPSGAHVMDVTDDSIRLLKSAEKKEKGGETPQNHTETHGK